MTLKEFLKLNKLKAGDFSKIFGVPRTTVYKWMQGVSVPRKKDIIRIMVFSKYQIMPNDFYRDRIKKTFK